MKLKLYGHIERIMEPLVYLTILLLLKPTTSRETGHNPKIVTIDLSQCFCNAVETCDLTIIKSSLKEANCENQEELCCPILKSPEDVIEGEKFGETLDAKNNSNVKIYSINSSSGKSVTEPLTSKPKSKGNCSCKSRAMCPHKYIDYGFGFHCSYTTVRCCIPLEDSVIMDVSQLRSDPLDENRDAERAGQSSLEKINKINITDNNPEHANFPGIDVSMTPQLLENGQAQFNGNLAYYENKPLSDNQRPEGELLIMEVTNWKDNSFEKDSECYCLPITKCRSTAKYNVNSIERRRDTLCPADLVQCCGQDVVQEVEEKRDEEAPQITQGVPPYQQPIQLPEDATQTSAEPEEPINISIVKEATLAPPVLPTQYFSNDPIAYQGETAYSPNHNSYPTHLSGPQSYQKGTYDTTNGQNIRPWVNLASPSSYTKYSPTSVINPYPQGYLRGPYTDPGSSRSSKPGGLFNTLTQFLG